jgi:broad specificity phosphatase PhoE
LGEREVFQKNFFTPDWKHSDEESFEEFTERARRALRHLESLSHERVLVVTHGNFIKAMFGVMLFGEKINREIFSGLYWRIYTNNTGVSVCEYTPERGWAIRTINDHAHLP